MDIPTLSSLLIVVSLILDEADSLLVEMLALGQTSGQEPSVIFRVLLISTILCVLLTGAGSRATHGILSIRSTLKMTEGSCHHVLKITFLLGRQQLRGQLTFNRSEGISHVVVFQSND